MELRSKITGDYLHWLEVILYNGAELRPIFFIDDYSRTNQAVVSVLSIDQVTLSTQTVLFVSLERFALNQYGTVDDTLTWFTAYVELENDSGDLLMQNKFHQLVFVKHSI